MILRAIEGAGVSTLVRGLMMALGYPVMTRYADQRVSHELFSNALNQITQRRRVGNSQSLVNINYFIAHMYTVVKEMPIHDDERVVYIHDGNIEGHFAIPGAEGLVFFRVTLSDGGLCDFEVRVGSEEVAKIEVAVMMQWMCLRPQLMYQDVDIEGHTLSIGLWTAAKLYEVAKDMAGKAATIDEALEMRG